MVDDRGPSISLRMQLQSSVAQDMRRVQSEATQGADRISRAIEASSSGGFQTLVDRMRAVRASMGASAVDAEKLGRTVTENARGGVDLWGRKIREATRDFRTFSNLLLIPFAVGGTFELLARVVSPITDAVKAADALALALQRVQAQAEILGKAGNFGQFNRNLDAFRQRAQQNQQFGWLGFGNAGGISGDQAVAAAGAALRLGATQDELSGILEQARLLQRVFGVELPQGIALVAGALHDDTKAMDALTDATGILVRNRKEAEAAFNVTKAAETLAREKQILEQLNKAPGADQLKASYAKTIADLEKIVQGANLAPTRQIKEANDAAVQLIGTLKQIEQQARDQTPLPLLKADAFEEQIARVRARTNREIDAILIKVASAQAALRDGFAQGAVQASGDAAVRAVTAKGNAEIAALEKSRRDDRIKQALDQEALEAKAQEERLQRQEQWVNETTESALRVGNALRGVWDEYNAGLIKSSQLTKSVLRALIQEFQGDLTQELTKAFVKALFSNAAGGAAGGSSGGGGNALVGTHASGGYLGRGSGTPISNANWFHTYRNAPWVTMGGGGIFTQPTNVIAEGRPEAVVPLSGGRSIPVQIMGGGGGTVVVNVTNNLSAIDQRGMDGALARSNKQLVAQVVAAIKSNNYGVREAVRGA